MKPKFVPTNNREVRQFILEYGKTHATFTVDDLARELGWEPRKPLYGGMTIGHVINYMERRYGELAKVDSPGSPGEWEHRDGYVVWQLTPIGRAGGNWDKRYKFERQPITPRKRRRVSRALKNPPKPKLQPSEQMPAHEEISVVRMHEPVTFITEAKFDEFMERVSILMDMLAEKDRVISTHEHHKQEMCQEFDQVKASREELQQEVQRLGRVIEGLQEQVQAANDRAQDWERRFRDKEHRMIQEVEEQAVTNLMSSGRFPQLKAFLDATEKGYQRREKKPATV